MSGQRSVCKRAHGSKVWQRAGQLRPSPAPPAAPDYNIGGEGVEACKTRARGRYKARCRGGMPEMIDVGEANKGQRASKSHKSQTQKSQKQ
eukprot:scaffold20706_cov148-Isochrysis_galbana.AAC.2